MFPNQVHQLSSRNHSLQVGYYKILVFGFCLSFLVFRLYDTLVNKMCGYIQLTKMSTLGCSCICVELEWDRFDGKMYF